MPEVTQMDLIIQELVRRANQSNKRLRLLEQKLQAMETRLDSLEQRSFEQKESNKSNFDEIDKKLKEINDKIIKLERSSEKIFEKLERTASKKELKEIEAMFDLLSPIGQDFVTREELERKLGYS